MNIRIIFLIIFTTIFNSSVFARDEYKFAMLPRYSPSEINKRIYPLIEFLSHKLKINIKIVTTKNFMEYKNRVISGEIDIGYQNPVIYTKISNMHNALLMVIKGKDGAKFSGIIITRNDSNIVKLSQLKGKKISIVSFNSAGGYFSQYLTLKKYGINTRTDMYLFESHNNKQENVILDVFFGNVNAGFIRESALKLAIRHIPPGRIKVLKRTEALPNWVLSVNHKLNTELKNKIKALLLTLSQNHLVTQALKITNFQTTNDSDYDVIREKDK
jgi:phosphonate transport system substrate-binding protein